MFLCLFVAQVVASILQIQSLMEEEAAATVSDITTPRVLLEQGGFATKATK